MGRARWDQEIWATGKRGVPVGRGALGPACSPIRVAQSPSDQPPELIFEQGFHLGLAGPGPDRDPVSRLVSTPWSGAGSPGTAPSRAPITAPISTPTSLPTPT